MDCESQPRLLPTAWSATGDLFSSGAPAVYRRITTARFTSSGVLVRHALLAGWTLLAVGTSTASGPAERTLTFEDRVRAQEAIERVYYSYQLGAGKPFETAVPRSVLEGKVRRYLEESAVLQAFWKIPVTDRMLQSELERMASGTKMPARLQELYAALGNDPLLIKECLARATLVDRLTHNFYAFDPTLHAVARRRAEDLRRRLVSGDLSPATELANRAESRIVLKEKVVRLSHEPQPFVQELGPDEFGKRRAELQVLAGGPSALQEASDSFSFSVLLSESPGELRLANYYVAKTAWDEWWIGASSTARGVTVPVVASGAADVPLPKTLGQTRTTKGCPDDDTWNQWTLREVPTPRRNHTAVWTGSVVVIWGGIGQTGLVNTGSRYDPATDTWLSASTVGAPSARQQHRAVWTGSSMVVWGGRGPINSVLADGGRYDPVTDSWMPVSMTGAPSARTGFTAIWSGTRLVVWGGSNATSLMSSGGRYDPASDIWTPTSMTNAPVPRSGHSAVWTGSRMIIWGGSGAAAGASGGQYDPVGDSWAATSTLNAPAARSSHFAVWTGSLMVVWGGSGAGVLNTGGRYDPVSDTWTATSTTNTPANILNRTVIWAGTVMIVWGGSVNNPADGTSTYPTDGGRYDPVSDTWAPTSLVGAPIGRSGLTLVSTGSSAILWGGVRAEGPEGDLHYQDSGARYDPASDTWTPTSLAGTPRARYVHSAIWTGNVMVIWGGTDADTDFNTGGRYDPVTDDWAGTSTIHAPSGRYGQATVWTGYAMVVWGGANRLNPPEYYLDTGGTYDPIADAWAPISTLGAPPGRFGPAAVWTGREMLVWGGYADGKHVATGGRYDPSTDSWRPMTSRGVPSARYYAPAVWTGRLMLVWGGEGDGPSYLGTGGRYDPANDRWTPISLAGAPTGRWTHTTLWTGRVMVVWGGDRFDANGTPTYFNDGGRYDPDADAWTPTSTVAAPSAREDHSAVWTGRDMVVWGGYGGGFLATGGRYDPAADTWTATSTAAAPSPRASHSAVWDGREMLVWGGWEFVDPYSILTDTGGSYRATPGETCNGLDDDCDGEIDEGGNALCDDGNPCTDEFCNGSEGCVSRPNLQPCDDDNPCTAADTCRSGACLGKPQTGTSCDDGNACTTQDACAAGECAGGPALVCEDGNLCTDDACDPATGCIVLGPHTCNDLNVCTDDSCDPARGCMFTPNTNACDDGSYCTHDETCQGGRCLPQTIPCDDHNPCTDDICNSWGCSHLFNSAPCNDGYECTVNDTCGQGYCNGTPTYGTTCDDHNPCTTDDVCQGYFCYGTYRDCNDDNPCTDDECDFLSGVCTHQIVADGSYCSDDDACTLGEACHGGVCSGAAPVDCFACPEGMEQIGTTCRFTLDVTGDSLFNQGYSCDADGTNRYNDCVGSYGFGYFDRGVNLIPVEVNLQFESGVSCSPRVSLVWLNGLSIGLFRPPGTCACYPLTQLVSFPNIDPTYYLPGEVNTIAITPLGGCEGLSKSPDLDGYYARVTVTYVRHDQRCEAGSCPPATGVCDYSPLPDGTACGDACTEGGSCESGSCMATAENCDDHNACTTDSCDPAMGCVFTANSAPCDDGNACTTGDTCGGGTCFGTPGPPPGEVASVSTSKSGTIATFIWDATAGATSYDVLRGRVLDWPVGSNPPTETCLADAAAGTAASDGAVPASGDGSWYLVRARNACGSGGFGWQEAQGVPTVPRVSATCP
jgi:N-acetylneuraminic acid mutarotase